MITLIIDNRNVYIQGASLSIIRKLVKAASYKVAGHHWSPSFRAKHWDGAEHLLKYKESIGYYAPAGLAIDLVRELKECGAQYRIDNRRYTHHGYTPIEWNSDITPRPYQLEATESLFKGALPGMGIFGMPIRSGKTKTAALVLQRIGRPSVFIVPSQLLLYQSMKDISDALPGVDVGIIGDSEYKPGFITIATIQTLHRMRGKKSDKGKNNGRPRDERYAKLIGNTDVLVVDEAHHFTGTSDWYKVPYDFNSMFKLAVSATTFLEDPNEQSRGVIWIKAVFGPLRISISMSDLIEAGYLMRQNVFMCEVSTPNRRGQKWSNSLRDACITSNPARNQLIAKITRKICVDMEMKTLIIANRHDHIAQISFELEKLGIRHAIVTSRQKRIARNLLAKLANGEFQALVGTVLGEGIDVPAVGCVINAEGGMDVKRTIQRQRNLTIQDGKRTAILIDFLDTTNEYFEDHSNARLEAYQAEPAFRIKVVR